MVRSRRGHREKGLGMQENSDFISLSSLPDLNSCSISLSRLSCVAALGFLCLW